MDIEKLEAIGLSKNEAKIYLALIKLGSAQAGEISKKTQINRRTTYDTLERLIKKGLVTFVIKANRRTFKPINPNRLIDFVKKRETIVNEIVPDLNILYKKSKEEREVNIFEGRKGIRSILNDILQYKEYVVFGSNEQFPLLMKHDYTIFQKEKKKRNIKSKVILSEELKGKEIVKTAFAKIKFIPSKFSSPTSTFVYGDKVALIVWSEVPFAMLIESKDVAFSYKKYFEELWSMAKK